MTVYRYLARVVRVIDGDTVVLDVDLGFHVTLRERFRLARVDAPEQGQIGSDEAVKLLERELSGQPVWILESERADRYGRWLATLYRNDSDTKSLNERLVDLGAVQLYDRDRETAHHSVAPPQ